MDVVSKIIQTEIIDKMPLTIEVVSIDALDLTVCTTAWVRVGTIFKDDNDVEFKVTAFNHNSLITVNNPGFVGNINLTRPHFMWGTKVQTNNEYGQKASYSEDKLPMIWLQDGAISDRKSKDKTIGADISCNIYFLDTYNEVWINDEIALNSLSPMKSLSTEFKKSLENNFTFFQSMDGYSEVENTRFGTENDNGLVNRHFGDDLSGVGVRLSMSSYADEACCGLIDTTVLPSCANGVASVLDSAGTVIATFNVPSGGTASDTIDDTQVFVNNSLGNAVAFGDFKAGASTVDLLVPDETYDIYLDGVYKSTVTIPTLSNDTLTITLL